LNKVNDPAHDGIFLNVPEPDNARHRQQVSGNIKYKSQAHQHPGSQQAMVYPGMHFTATTWAGMRVYRITEIVGRWSMVDIYVVTILVALVNLGVIADIDAGPAAIYFAAVVIITIFAAKSFDPRLIWDNIESQTKRS